MKKNVFSVLVSGVLFLAGVACNDNLPEQQAEQEGWGKAGSSRLDASSIDIASLDPVALTYFEQLKVAIFATGSNQSEQGDSPLRAGSNDGRGTVTPIEPEDQEGNTFCEKLQSIDIRDVETGEELSFFEMEIEEQKDFLEQWVLCQALQMTEKLAIDTGVRSHVQEVNEKIAATLIEEGYSKTNTRSGTDFKIKDSKAFFDKVRSKLSEPAQETSPVLALRASTSVPASTVRSVLASKARKGDFLLALPVHNASYIYVNIFNTFTVGHAGVINSSVTYSTDTTEQITMEAWAADNAVKGRTISNWKVPCYVMGIQKITYEWRWRWFKSGLYKVTTPVSNPSALATKAASYKNRRYVHWYEFPDMKWAAPAGFTCTTLVWYCCKEVYGINVSDWWKTWVTPSDLFTDESTYVRGEIKN